MRQMEFSIVPMELMHLPEVMEIERDSFIDPWTEYAFRNEISDNPHAAYFVALVEDRVVAFIGGWLIIDQLYITNLAVDPRYRQQGIAKALLDAIMAYSWGEGIREATLEVRVSNNSAISLYQKKGFVSVGIRPGYYLNNNEDALIMWKELKGDVADDLDGAGNV